MTYLLENIALRAENAALREQVRVLTEQLQAALERDRTPPPGFVKPNKAERDKAKGPRRKRSAEHNGARRREKPTQVVTHKLERCPDCAGQLHGNSIARKRQVVDLPPPQAVEVTEHQVLKGWCQRCGRWHTPKLDLHGQVLGQGRLGTRLVSLVAYLRTVLRLPVRAIQEYLRSMHCLTVSIGELCGLLDKLRQAAQPALKELRAQLHASGVVHGDETGWREDGQNGYAWSFSTPGKEAIRYFEQHASRAGSIVLRMLSKKFKGVLVSDFYGAYNVYKGRHQRCWVHLLRDLHKLKEEQAENQEIVVWAQRVRELHDVAQTLLRQGSALSQAEREAAYAQLVARVQPLGLAYAKSKGHPCWGLAKRLLRHQDELFQFVRVDGLAADNNLAERSLRPLVVVRKISGGTRSGRGSATRMALASLFGTWQARGLNTFEQCHRLLTQTP